MSLWFMKKEHAQARTRDADRLPSEEDDFVLGGMRVAQANLSLVARRFGFADCVGKKMGFVPAIAYIR
jgi:hypothetical protein